MSMAVVVIYVSIIIVMFFATVKDFGCFAVTPRQIYDANNVNIFACCLIWLFMLIVNPIYFCTRFLWWLFHVGRDE